MSEPKRIQRKRTKGWRMPENTVYVGRPTRYGNPFKVGETNTDTGEIVTLDKSLEYYRFFLQRKYQGDTLTEFLAPLRGKDLACFCKQGSPCHADILLELANQPLREKGDSTL